MCNVGFALLHIKTFNLCLHFLLPLTLICFLLCRLTAEEVESIEADTSNRWQGVYINRASPTPSESAATVKSLIKSFDLGCSGTVYFVVNLFLGEWIGNFCRLVMQSLSANSLSVLGSGLSMECHYIVGSVLMRGRWLVLKYNCFHVFLLQVALDKISQFTRSPGAL